METQDRMFVGGYNMDTETYLCCACDKEIKPLEIFSLDRSKNPSEVLCEECAKIRNIVYKIDPSQIERKTVKGDIEVFVTK